MMETQHDGAALEILIVEDSPTQSARLEYILVRQGYRVKHAPNGRQALETAARDKPDMIISDVVMPEMDGFELCRRLKEDRALSDVPVILVTTLSDPGDVIRGLESGADNFIIKPYDERHLLNRVQFVLLNRQMRSAERGGVAVEVFFNGSRHVITADRIQILNLLLSTYEAAIQRNRELTRAKEALAERGAILAQRERELHEANSFLEHLIAASPSIITALELVDGDARASYVSPNVGWMLGYGVDEIVGVPGFWFGLLHPEDREREREAFVSALQSRSTDLEREYRFRTKDGSYRSLLTSMRIEYDDALQPIAIVCHALDVTERKHTQMALAESEERTHLILATAHDAFVGMSQDGLVTEWNLAAERIFGWARSEVIGRELSELIIPPPQREAHRAGVKRLLETGEGPILNSRIEVSALRRGGEEFPIELLVWPIQRGSETRFNAFMRDITQEVRAERAIRQAKEEAERANHAKSEFLSRMSHDLRTPLNAILGFAQLIEMEGGTPDQIESARQIMSGGRHLLGLINEVLDIARIEAGHLSLSPESLDAGEVVLEVTQMIHPLAASRRIKVIPEVSPGCGIHVQADRQRYRQILVNLVANAVKYNREGGEVRIFCDGPATGVVRTSVSDTGKGIAPEKLSLLFRPFERLGAEAGPIEGTGLGLTLAKGFAEAMGGTIGVSSTVEHGSTFWVDLPEGVRSPRHDAAVEDPAPAPARPAAGTVLYVEDNASNVRLVQRILARRPGVVLVHGPTGEAGLSLALSERPDLILLDLHLPDVAGLEVLLRLSANPATRDIPVAVLSADAVPGQSQRLRDAGAIAYLTKPLDIGQVLRLIDERLAPQEPDGS